MSNMESNGTSRPSPRNFCDVGGVVMDVVMCLNIHFLRIILEEPDIGVVPEFVIPAEAGIHLLHADRYGCPRSRA